MSQITTQKRKSCIEIYRLYFWTATINNWYKLLDIDVVKNMIAANKSYEFWQRDSLTFKLTQRATAIQKIEYIRNIPVAKHWNLAATREQYKYSSAQVYHTCENDFGFLKHIMAVV
ncbi:MAG: hypothetical protein QM541_11190 [Flavobacterium sp.]|nr:hypothetical protein [Flavobacterium sp.]